MSDDVSSKVKKIVADHLGIDEAKVQDDSSFIDDLGDLQQFFLLCLKRHLT